MESAPASNVSQILMEWQAGDASALNRLTPLVYMELHRIAQRSLARERPGHPLQPSALVNEAFLRLLGRPPLECDGRNHFFAVAARLMREILIDFARAQQTTKRGSGQPHLTLSDAGDLAWSNMSPVDFLDLDAALTELATLDERQAQVVELRYFAGLENSAIAEVLSISEPTVVRDWRVARAWLFSRLHGA